MRKVMLSTEITLCLYDPIPLLRRRGSNSIRNKNNGLLCNIVIRYSFYTAANPFFCHSPLLNIYIFVQYAVLPCVRSSHLLCPPLWEPRVQGVFGKF